MSFAAKQANIEQESFNSSLTIFAKNAGLAEKGTGALYSGLKNLNPQLLQSILNAKDQEGRLKLVSDAMAQMTDATQKAALASVVFGKGGVEMARFLDQGRASIDAMKKSARDMGIIVPDELLQRAGELDDKLDLLSKVIHVQLSEALINLAPLLTGAMQGFAGFSKEINSTSAALDSFVANPSVANFNRLLEAIGSLPIRKGTATTSCGRRAVQRTRRRGCWRLSSGSLKQASTRCRGSLPVVPCSEGGRARSQDRPSLFAWAKFKNRRRWLRLQRFVARLLVPDDLAQVALINQLATCRTVIEVILFANEGGAVHLAWNRRAKVRKLRRSREVWTPVRSD